jgi:tyrosine-protein phosphatase SIW14
MGTSPNRPRARRAVRHLVAALACATLASSCATVPAGSRAGAGLRNFDEVEAGVLYRGAQPERRGYQELSRLGIRTVINLRQEDDTQAGEEAAVEAAGRAIPMKGFGEPSAERMSQALAAINDPANQPVFVHCRRGADRTGTVVAAYEIQSRCVDNARALRKAEEHGMSPLELAMKRFIRSLARSPSCTDKASTPEPDAPRTSPAYTP